MATDELSPGVGRPRRPSAKMPLVRMKATKRKAKMPLMRMKVTKRKGMSKSTSSVRKTLRSEQRRVKKIDRARREEVMRGEQHALQDEQVG